ncbi:uncharacterized protein LOC125591972 [Brassica napus]|uniref:uncharacterized protein LOC125591972 n=1 Tax=Brassica napus TaxID=3708 RepID=UPI00207A5F0C|nr:uncharacterized protein LOC125591972 [Brassica napus]
MAFHETDDRSYIIQPLGNIGHTRSQSRCVWLQSMTNHIRVDCGMTGGADAPTVMYEENAACIDQLKDGYIKGDRTKHILPKFFFTHDLQKAGEVQAVQVCSSDNSADLFTKSLPTCTFRKLTHQIGMRRLKYL